MPACGPPAPLEDGLSPVRPPAPGYVWRFAVVGLVYYSSVVADEDFCFDTRADAFAVAADSVADCVVLRRQFVIPPAPAVDLVCFDVPPVCCDAFFSLPARARARLPAPALARVPAPVCPRPRLPAPVKPAPAVKLVPRPVVRPRARPGHPV